MISSALAFEMGSAPIPKHRVVISSPSVSCTPPCSRQCIGVEPFSPRAAAQGLPAEGGSAAGQHCTSSATFGLFGPFVNGHLGGRLSLPAGPIVVPSLL